MDAELSPIQSEEQLYLALAALTLPKTEFVDQMAARQYVAAVRKTLREHGSSDKEDKAHRSLVKQFFEGIRMEQIT